MKTMFFGLKTYQESMMIMDQSYNLVESSGFPVVIGFEYYPVITIGQTGRLKEDLLLSTEEIKEQGIDINHSNRAGAGSVHSPGQMVIYPLVPYRKLKITVKDVQRCLEEATISWLETRQIKASRAKKRGVVTAKGQIAFTEISGVKGISKHGIAINVSNDLKLFRHIRPCGAVEMNLDSMEANGVSVDLNEAFKEWNSYFTERLLATI